MHYKTVAAESDETDIRMPCAAGVICLLLHQQTGMGEVQSTIYQYTTVIQRRCLPNKRMAFPCRINGPHIH